VALDPVPLGLCRDTDLQPLRVPLLDPAGIRGCNSPGSGWIATGAKLTQSTRIVQPKRRPTSKVDLIMV
jgi:hypothetical protein